MEDLLMSLWPYVPFVFFVAAVLDVLCFTGLFLYGGAMVGGVLAFYLSGAITASEIIIASSLGTLTGSTINFYLGRYVSHYPPIQKFLNKPRALQFTSFLTTKPLWLIILTGRFITLARPLYSLVLGASQIKPRKFFLYEIPIVIVWASLWLFIFIQGEQFIRVLFFM